MPQVLKEEVRARIVEAALAVFAADGFERATMTAIAERARVGAASIYRYYASKDELFAAAVPDELARRFDSLLERRVRALGRNSLDDLGDEMLQFWTAHRLAVVILLDRSAERFVDLLVQHTARELGRVSPRVWFVLRCIFENTRRLLANVLEKHADPDELREAIEAFWSYQIAGLRGLKQHVER